ncbi:MAG: GAF domain-containing protein, partial [Fimbriimonadales bacterium]
MVLPILRGSTVVALVDLHGPAGGFLSWQPTNLRVAELSMQQLANTYEARSVHRILEQTAEFKVALYERESDALQNLIRFVHRSSGMQYTALRRLESDGSLLCIASHGFGSSFSENQLSLSDLQNDYIPFASVVETKDHWIAEDLNDDVYTALRLRPELGDVRSFVACPVLIGEELWGVLSFAAAVEYEYSNLEVYSLRALANLAGVALEAVQSADQASSTHFDDGRLMQAVLSNEVVVATRHEMYDQLAVVGSARSAILEVVEPLADPNRVIGSRLDRKDVNLLIAEAHNLDTAHEQMNKVMETIRFSQSELQEEHREVIVRAVWR